MPLSAGTRLGPYEIVAPLGAGGMGEVYRARDTRLNREVAVKILSATAGFSSDLKQRFEREARAISSLNHPHICTLHDVGHHDGTDFLVMELLEGQSLADRLERGPLPLSESLTYGEQIADALERAHRKGIVHRDLKPGNIVLTKSGAKLLDFGLAKPVAHHLGATAEATRSQPITAQGTILGTYQYMAPEQIEGKEADARTDIFAFGAVLYEMATGRKAFEGKSQISVASAILEKDPPPISKLQPLTPPALEHVVERCLKKDPEERWQSAHDVRAELEWIRMGGGSPAAAPTDRRRLPWIWPVAIGLLLVIAFLGGRYWSRGEQGRVSPVYQAALPPPPGHSYVAYDFALSPDGTRLAFTATSSNGMTTLWVKSLSTDSSQEFAGTEGAGYPFWSPDSQEIGFFAGAKLKRLHLATGGVQSICDARVGRGGTWNRDGTIVFAPHLGSELARVASTGGVPAPVTKVGGGVGESHRWPVFLPDGRHFLFFIDWSGDRNGIYVGSLDRLESRLVSADIRGNVAFAAGRMLFVRDGSLLAQRFDTERLELVGEAAPVVTQEMEQDPGFGKAGFSVSESGALVYQSRRSYSSRLVWYDRSGKEFGAVGEPAAYEPALSPDGRSVAIIFDVANNGHRRVHVVDMARGTVVAITAESDQDVGDVGPVWSPDSTKVAYVRQGRPDRIQVRSADASGSVETLAEGARLMTTDWSPDGRWVVYMNFINGLPQLWTYDFSLRKAAQLTEPPTAEAQFSSDGRWLAYTSNRTFGPEVMLRPLGRPGAQVQVSTAGGTQPRWRADGKELFYIGPDNRLMSVALAGSASLSVSPPKALFQTRMNAPRYALFQYDVSPDGQRFLINSLPREDAAAPLTLVTDWTQLGR